MPCNAAGTMQVGYAGWLHIDNDGTIELANRTNAPKCTGWFSGRRLASVFPLTTDRALVSG
jgi:hypothetical protein